MPRPYRVVGYPWVPALFVVAMTGLVLNTLYERPLQSLLGVGLVALGVPFFTMAPGAHWALSSSVQVRTTVTTAQLQANVRRAFRSAVCGPRLELVTLPAQCDVLSDPRSAVCGPRSDPYTRTSVS